MRKYKQYTETYKREVLEMAASGEVSIAQLERDLGITTGLLLKWRERYQVKKENGAVKVEPSDLEAAQAEIRRLQRKLAVAEQERDILKKAVRIFSQMEG